MTDFPISKRAVNVVIEPLDPAVQKALALIQQKYPTLLDKARVEKIIVHPGGGTNFGEVRSGPGENPRWIHIFKGKIEEHVRRHSAGSPVDALAHAIEYAIVGVLAHEAGHMRENMTPHEPFHGEPHAEEVSRQTLQRIYPKGLPMAAKVLDHLRWKLVPGAPPAEPDLDFLCKVASGDRTRTVKSAMRILRCGSVPAAVELQEADDFNRGCMKRRRMGRVLGFISHLVGVDPCEADFAERLAQWQDSHGIDPTGKMDDVTVAAVRARMPDFSEFPRNFGVVWMGKLFRGGQPDSPNQLKAMRDKLGVRRIVTLNEDMPELPEWCEQLGLDHVQASLTDGRPDDPGWSVIGPDVVGFMTSVPTFVHCRHGMDRTGGVVAACRADRAWPCDLAYHEAKDYGFKDRFVDMVDMMCHKCQQDPSGHNHPPFDTDQLRSLIQEQEVLDSTPTDLHYNGLGSSLDDIGYESDGFTILNPFSRQMPMALPGGGGR